MKKIIVTESQLKNVVQTIIKESELGGEPKKKYRYTNCEVEIQIETEDDVLYPIFDGETTCESGEFDYEYGSISGTHDPGLDCYVEDVDWNRENFSEEENEIIEKYYQEHSSKIEEKLIEKYEPPKPDYDPDFD